MECDCIGAVFYVPNCSNMQYLGSFSPSELLCPVTHVWVPLEQCRPLLRESLFCRFAPRVDGGEQLREWEDDPTSDATPEEAQAVSNAIIHHRSMFYFLSVRVIALAHGLHCVVNTLAEIQSLLFVALRRNSRRLRITHHNCGRTSPSCASSQAPTLSARRSSSTPSNSRLVNPRVVYCVY